MFCRECGKELRPGDKFCSNCGAKVIEDVVSEPVQAAEGSKGSSGGRPVVPSVVPLGTEEPTEPVMTFSSSEKKSAAASFVSSDSNQEDATENNAEKAVYGRQTFDFKWDTLDFEHEKVPSQEAFDWGDLLGIREREEQKNQDILTRKTINLAKEREAIERMRREEEIRKEAERKVREAMAVQQALEASDRVAAEALAAEQALQAASAAEAEPQPQPAAYPAEEVALQIEEEPEDATPTVDMDFMSVDKFYTFQKKNAEFEALLNREYDRMKKAGSSKEMMNEIMESDETVDPKEAENAVQFIDDFEKTLGLEKAAVKAAMEKAEAEAAAQAQAQAAAEAEGGNAADGSEIAAGAAAASDMTAGASGSAGAGAPAGTPGGEDSQLDGQVAMAIGGQETETVAVDPVNTANVAGTDTAATSSEAVQPAFETGTAEGTGEAAQNTAAASTGNIDIQDLGKAATSASKMGDTREVPAGEIKEKAVQAAESENAGPSPDGFTAGSDSSEPKHEGFETNRSGDSGGSRDREPESAGPTEGGRAAGEYIGTAGIDGTSGAAVDVLEADVETEGQLNQEAVAVQDALDEQNVPDEAPAEAEGTDEAAAKTEGLGEAPAEAEKTAEPGAPVTEQAHSETEAATDVQIPAEQAETLAGGAPVTEQAPEETAENEEPADVKAPEETAEPLAETPDDAASLASGNTADSFLEKAKAMVRSASSDAGLAEAGEAIDEQKPAEPAAAAAEQRSAEPGAPVDEQKPAEPAVTAAEQRSAEPGAPAVDAEAFIPPQATEPVAEEPAAAAVSGLQINDDSASALYDTWSGANNDRLSDDQLEEMARAREFFFNGGLTGTADDEPVETQRISKAEIAAFVKLAEAELGITDDIKIPDEPDEVQPFTSDKDTLIFGEQISFDLSGVSGDQKQAQDELYVIDDNGYAKVPKDQYEAAAAAGVNGAAGAGAPGGASAASGITAQGAYVDATAQGAGPNTSGAAGAAAGAPQGQNRTVGTAYNAGAAGASSAQTSGNIQAAGNANAQTAGNPNAQAAGSVKASGMPGSRTAAGSKAGAGSIRAAAGGASAVISEPIKDTEFKFGYEDEEEFEDTERSKGKLGTIIITILAILMVLEIICFVIRYNFPDSGIAQMINPFFQMIDDKLGGLFGG